MRPRCRSIQATPSRASRLAGCAPRRARLRQDGLVTETAAGAQRIFISWSGEQARAASVLLREWLREMFDGVDPWVSDVDIASGAQGLVEIHASLGRAEFGLIVVTPDNQSSPWLNYEAGALSRAV